MDIINKFREQINHRMKIHYYMIIDINKKLKNYEIDNSRLELLLKNNSDMNKKIITLKYSLIISYLIIIYLLITK